MRNRLPREAHAAWSLKQDAPRDRLAPLHDVERGRLVESLPEKYQRMRRSPFAFFRGAAVLMAADLASQRRTGITVQMCGDAHVRNLGAYEALDGALVFDLNDFDETLPGPWEWDVKRLATSLILAGEESGQSASVCEKSVRRFARAYRTYLLTFGTMRFATLARYLITRRRDDAFLEEIFREAERVTPNRNLRKLTVDRGRRFRFRDRSPLARISPRVAAEVVTALGGYAGTLIASRQRTLARYHPIDVSFKLVGTGSVGTRDYVVLLFGNGEQDPLFLQVKQQLASCYSQYLRPVPRVRHEGQRAAEGQQLMQTLSDPFIGYTRFGGHDYLVRQLADHKAAVDPAALTRRTLWAYARLCGEVLAKGHARTSDAARLAGYLGKSASFDEAIVAFATTYAGQVRNDYRLFKRSEYGRPKAQSPKPKA